MILFLFRVTPACALTFVVYENVINFLLPDRWHQPDKLCNPATGDDGQYYRTWCYYQALFCNSSDGFIHGKKYINRAKLTAQCVYTFYRQLHLPAACEYDIFSEQFMYNNARGIVLLWRTLPSPPPPLSLAGIKFMYIPLALTKAWTTRDAFLKVFFLLLDDNSNITCENYLQLIKGNVQYLVKNYLIFLFLFLTLKS